MDPDRRIVHLGRDYVAALLNNIAELREVAAVVLDRIATADAELRDVFEREAERDRRRGTNPHANAEVTLADYRDAIGYPKVHTARLELIDLLAAYQGDNDPDLMTTIDRAENLLQLAADAADPANAAAMLTVELEQILADPTIGRPALMQLVMLLVDVTMTMTRGGLRLADDELDLASDRGIGAARACVARALATHRRLIDEQTV